MSERNYGKLLQVLLDVVGQVISAKEEGDSDGMMNRLDDLEQVVGMIDDRAAQQIVALDGVPRQALTRLCFTSTFGEVEDVHGTVMAVISRGGVHLALHDAKMRELPLEAASIMVVCARILECAASLGEGEKA